MSSNKHQTRKLYRRDPSGTSFSSRLKVHEETNPTLLQNETSVVIRVRAVALNYRDANMLNNTNPWDVRPDGVPCSDAAGDVVEVGPRVTRFKMGDKVTPILDQHSITGREQQRRWLGGEVDGVLATHVVFDEERIVRVPDGLSYAEAACLVCAGVTAWSGLANGGSLVPGISVLTQGTGGVSMMGLKLARAAGCKVILSSSSDEKLDGVKAMQGIGPIATVNYSKNPDWDEHVLKLNGGVGVDIVFENGGTSSVMRSIRATKKGGIVSQIGYLGKQNAGDLDGLLHLLIEKTVSLRGINVGSRLDFEDMNRFISASGLRFEDTIDRKFTFEQAAEAFEYLWSGKHVGKIVIEL